MSPTVRRATLGWGGSGEGSAKRMRLIPPPLAATAATIVASPLPPPAVPTARINTLPVEVLALILGFFILSDVELARDHVSIPQHRRQKEHHATCLLVCKHWLRVGYGQTWREVVLRGNIADFREEWATRRQLKLDYEAALGSPPFRTHAVVVSQHGRLPDGDDHILEFLHIEFFRCPTILQINLKKASACSPLYPPLLSNEAFHYLTSLDIATNKDLAIRDVPPGTELPCKLESVRITAYHESQTLESLIRALKGSAETLRRLRLLYWSAQHSDGPHWHDLISLAPRLEEISFQREVLPPVLEALPTLPALKALEFNGYIKVEELELLATPTSTPPTLRTLAMRPVADVHWHPLDFATRRRINEDRYGKNFDPLKTMFRALARNIETGGSVGALEKLKLLSERELDLATEDGKYLIDVCKEMDIEVTDKVWSCFDDTRS